MSSVRDLPLASILRLTLCAVNKVAYQSRVHEGDGKKQGTARKASTSTSSFDNVGAQRPALSRQILIGRRPPAFPNRGVDGRLSVRDWIRVCIRHMFPTSVLRHCLAQPTRLNAFLCMIFGQQLPPCVSGCLFRAPEGWEASLRDAILWRRSLLARNGPTYNLSGTRVSPDLPSPS